MLRLGADRGLDVLRELEGLELRRLGVLREDGVVLRPRLDEGVENDRRLDEGVGNDRILVVGVELRVDTEGRRVETDGRCVETDGREELRIEELPRLMRDDEELRELWDGADERVGVDRRDELRNELRNDRAGEERLLGGAAARKLEESSSKAAERITASTTM